MCCLKLYEINEGSRTALKLLIYYDSLKIDIFAHQEQFAISFWSMKLLVCYDISMYCHWSVFLYLPPWPHLLVPLCIKVTKKRSTSAHRSRFHYKNRLWLPTDQTRDGETENTGRKDFMYKVLFKPVVQCGTETWTGTEDQGKGSNEDFWTLNWIYTSRRGNG